MYITIANTTRPVYCTTSQGPVFITCQAWSIHSDIFCPYIQPGTQCWVQKVEAFFKFQVVMMHIILKGPQKHKFFTYTQPRPQGWGQKFKTFFLEVVMMHIKLKGMECRAPCKHILCLHTPSTTGMGSKGQNIFRRRAPFKHVFCPYKHPKSVGLGQKVRKNAECGIVAYQIKGKEV